MSKRTILLFILAILFLQPGKTQQQKPDADRPPKMPRGYLNETHLKVAYALGFLKLVDTSPDIPDDIESLLNIVYREVDTTRLMLDLYKQKKLHTRVPALIFIHGGGWSKGKRSDYLPYLIDFAEKGYVTITVTYRLSGVAHFPAALEDVKCAIRWVRAHAQEYSIDPDRIALIGGSAGGHLALMAGYTEDNEFSAGCSDTISARVQAIVDFYGPVDLTTAYAQGRHECHSFLGTTYQDNPGIYKEASPRFYISADNPPTLIFQGTIDKLVPVRQSDSLHLWLDHAGVVNEYHRLKGWPHTMDAAVKVNRYCQYYMDKFLSQHL